MTFTLTVDAPAWRGSVQARVTAARDASGHAPVPVIKGNGYGFGQQVLVDEVLRLGLDRFAVGTVHEAECLAPGLPTSTEVVVLEPFTLDDSVALISWNRLTERSHPRVIRVIADASSLEYAARLALDSGHSIPVMVEGRTSLARFGFTVGEMGAALATETVQAALARGALAIRGLSLHLPLSNPRRSGKQSTPAAANARTEEVLSWARHWQGMLAGIGVPNAAEEVSISHVSDDELRHVAMAHPGLTIRLRTGSSVWLSARDALTAAGTVLAVHPIAQATHVGYRQRRVSAHGTLVVVSGGTSHGIGLSAPSAATTLRQRITTLGIGVLDAAGRARSPFRWAGRQRWFVEPPHQHVSMLWLPRGCVVPAVGMSIPAEVRFTTSRFDAVLGLD